MNNIMFNINNELKLEMAFPLIEFEGIPIVFVCTNNGLDVFFCICTEIRGLQQWIIIKTTCKSIEKLLLKQCDINSFIKENKKVYIARAEESIDNISYKEILTSDIEKCDIPPEGVYLELMVDDSLKKLYELQVRISDALFNKINHMECGTLIVKEYVERIVNTKETLFSQCIISDYLNEFNTLDKMIKINTPHKKNSLLYSLYLFLSNDYKGSDEKELLSVNNLKEEAYILIDNKKQSNDISANLLLSIADAA